MRRQKSDGCWGPAHKQKLTNKQIREQLQEEGYQISLVTINIELARIHKRGKEVFIRQSYEYGDRLEYYSSSTTKRNIILIGTPGAGKTHYATALGIAACMKGKSVLFATVPNLIVELKEAMRQNQLSAYRKKFERYSLVILDELGYVSFDKAGCEIFFNLPSNRHGKGSIIITTNLTFENWETLFKDPVLTGAMIDRLAHEARVLDISREQGGRFEETIAWMTNKQPPQATHQVGDFSYIMGEGFSG